MNSQSTLFREASTKRDESLPVIDERLRGTKFVELSCHSIINSPESTNMDFWSANPYVGCEFGCTYCYARFAHRYVVERARDRGALRGALADLPRAQSYEPFEQRIFVKRRSAVLKALDTDLRRVRRRTTREGLQTILIGTGTDPYQPAERQFQITRTILERLRSERGLKVGIITKSPLVCRDIDHLKAIARRNLVSVYVSITCVDLSVIKIFEARSPMPHARLRALKKLTSSGIRAGLLVAPVLPGITDTVSQIERIMQAARDAGTQFVHPVPLRLGPDTRQRVFPILETQFPRLSKKYSANYDQNQHVSAEYHKALRARFNEIGQRFGIVDTGSDYNERSSLPATTQLSLF